MHKYYNVIFIDFLDKLFDYNTFYIKMLQTSIVPQGRYHSAIKSYTLDYSPNVIAADIASHQINPFTLIYIQCHGTDSDLSIMDDCDINVEQGVEYLANVIGFNRNASIRCFLGNNQPHLRISLVICGAGETQSGTNYSFGKLLHTTLLDKYGVFSEVVARRGFSVTTLPNDPKKYIEWQDDGPLLHKAKGSKVMYFWQEEHGVYISKEKDIY